MTYLVSDIYETKTKVTIKNNFNVLLDIWDTGGTEEFGAVRKLGFLDSNVFIFCYSIDKKQSLQNLKGLWIPEAMEKLKMCLSF